MKMDCWRCKMLLRDRNTWKPFRLGDEKYFELRRGESKYLKSMYLGDYPYISTTRENNGICAYVSEYNRSGNLISLAYDGSIGACFYQPKPFFASEKIVTIDLVQRELTPSIAIFLITVIKLEAEMYSYGGRKWTVERQLKNTNLYLPVDDNNEPDYDYMEQYISSLNGDVEDIPDYFLNEGYLLSRTQLYNWSAHNCY